MSDTVAYQAIWASLVPIKANDGTFPAIRTFVEFISRNDATYYTYLYADMFHHIFETQGVQGIRRVGPLWLEIKSKAIRCLQKEINALGSGIPTDETLSVVLALAAQDVNWEALELPLTCYPTSPLAKFQLLGSVGYLRPELSHLKALYHLVSRKGGIRKVKSFGVGYTLALCVNRASSYGFGH